jgi:integrase
VDSDVLVQIPRIKVFCYYRTTMKIDLGKIFSSKNITQSSQSLYERNLVRLNDGNEIKNFNFLKDKEATLSKLEKYKPNTQRTYIISIVSLLKCLIEIRPTSKLYKKLYSTYYAVLDYMNTSLKTANVKTEKEKENWITQEEVLEKWSELKAKVGLFEGKSKKKFTESEFDALRNFLLLSLYALQKPRRNRDYQDMIVVKKTPPTTSDTSNVLDLKENKFVFNNFKTKKKYETQTVTISPELREIIDMYLKHHPTYKPTDPPVQLLVTFDGVPFTKNNDITRMLYKIFDNKKVGVNMLRHIFLTDKYKDVMAEMKQDATQMGTSSNMVQDHYIKVD